MMSDDELADLAADIKANGQLHPIFVDDGGLLVDGRDRFEACKRAGVEPYIEKLNGHDATTLIVSANLARRNLTKGQKAMALALIYPEPEKGGRGNKGKSAEIADFSQRRLREARSVLAFSRELALTVIAGTEPLDAAVDKVQQERQRMDSEEAQLARLRTEAPDLADQVSEERLTLKEAMAALDVRKTEAAALEKSKRETLLRLTSAGYTATVAWSNEEFAQSVCDRLGTPRISAVTCSIHFA